MTRDGSAGTVPDEQEGSRRSPRSTLLSSTVLVGALLLASLLGNAALHALQGASGLQRTPAIQRAWVSYPSAASKGLRPGAPLYFDVMTPGTSPVTWTVHNDGRVIGHGTLAGTSGTALQVLADTSRATPDSWLSISVGDLRTPLRVWVT